MFKIYDCFKTCDIFNDILIKRFEDNFDAYTSRLWMSPGHIAFLKDGKKLHTCDARPYDFSASPSEPQTDELLTATSSILEVFFDTEGNSTRMFVVVSNGDVQIFEYRIQLYEWARIGYFNVNIVSPNTNNNHVHVSQALISHHQNMIYWSQETAGSNTAYDLHKREVPLNGVREITQSAIGIPHKLLKNCPKFELVEVRDNICIIPHLSNFINLYIIISARLHIWLFHIDGKLLWRGIIGDSPIDFVTLCTKSLGLWHQTGTIKVCNMLNIVKNFVYIMHNEELVCIAANGEIRKKIALNIDVADVEDCFIMQNIICLFKRNFVSLQIHNLSDGKLAQSFDLTDFSPISGTWCVPSSIPSVGFYASKKIYRLNYKKFNSLLLSESPCIVQSSNLLKNEQFHALSLLQDAVHHEFQSCDIPPLKSVPKVLQSKGLLLAVLQSCRENGFRSDDFPVRKTGDLLENDNTPDTKLKDLLYPLVNSFQKLESYRNSKDEDSQ